VKLEELSLILKAELRGNPSFVCQNVASITNPNKNSISVIKKINNPSDEILVNAGAILTTFDLASSIKLQTNLLLVKDIDTAFIKLLNIFKYQSSMPKLTPVLNNLSKGKFSLFLGENVTIGDNFSYGANVVIQDNVSIGNDVHIGSNVVICYGTIIGNNVQIDHGCIIGSEGFGNVQDSTSTWRHLPHLGNVVIKDFCSLGANCCIDRGTIDDTIINKSVIIDNLVHIAHNVIVGENTAIAAKVGIAGSCIIGKRNKIGGMVGIIDHITTADDVTISATSTVTKNLSEAGIYTGILPISKHSTWKRNASWFLKLDKMFKYLNFRKK